MGGSKSHILQIERLQSRSGYGPFHRLAIQSGDREIAVLISLFGWLVFRFTLSKVVYGGPCPTYVEELDTGRSLLAPKDTFYHLNPAPRSMEG